MGRIPTEKVRERERETGGRVRVYIFVLQAGIILHFEFCTLWQLSEVAGTPFINDGFTIFPE